MPTTTSPWPRRVIVALVVLLVLLVVADRGGDWAAERLAADNLQSSQHLDARPDVDIHGVPFLTQFASGKYDHISLSASDLAITKGSFRLSSLHVDLNQLTVTKNFHHFHVASATADALLGYAALSARLGVTISYAGSNRIKASKKIDVPVLGSVTPSISVAPVLINGALGFGKATINGAGENLGIVSSVLKKIFDLQVPLDGIPFQLRVRSLTAGASGVSLELVGADLTYDSDS